MGLGELDLKQPSVLSPINPGLVDDLVGYPWILEIRGLYKHQA